MNALKSVRSSFRTRAVIDWIELTVTLKNGTQFRYVQDKLQSILGLTIRPYVKPVNAGAGNVATRFRLRLHDAHAATLRDLEHTTAALALAYPFAETPEVTGIEVALDFYSRHDPNAVPDLVASASKRPSGVRQSPPVRSGQSCDTEAWQPLPEP